MQILLEYLKTILKLLLGRGVVKSYSQFGEDVMMQSLCKDSHGTYVDVGAYHPVLYSNTYALYKKGWHGLVIDPNSLLKPLYALLRPQDMFIHSGVGLEEGSGTYHRFSDGAYNTFNSGTAEASKKLQRIRFLGSEECNILPLSRIVRDADLAEIGFLNIDAEGSDLSVLHSYDWSVRPRIISIESGEFNPDTPQKSEIYQFLRSKNYRLVGFSGVSLLWADSTI